MSTTVWPPVSPEDLIRAEEESLSRELEWLLDYLQETFASLKEGLEECADLLSPDQGQFTLAVSSHRSESIKGFVTRVGTRVIKGDVHLRIPSLPPPRGQQSYKLSISSDPQAPTLVLEQLTAVRTLINTSLDIIDVSRWTGDAKNASFISGQLRLLLENVQEAKQTLKANPATQEVWTDHIVDDEIFDPPCPSHVAFGLDISEAALQLHVRILEPVNGTGQPDSMSGFGIRDRLVYALGVARPPTHDEVDETFTYRGQAVRVKEKLRVESQDPTLMAAMAKLSALEHSVAMGSRALDTVMGKLD